MEKVIIFGAGGSGRKLAKRLYALPFPCEILAFSDNAPEFRGKRILGVPVICPDEIPQYSYDRILVAAMDVDSISHQLARYGVDMGKVDASLYREMYNESEKARISALENASKILYELGVEGPVAELGVYKGEFARHINCFFPDRTLYLFDTFEGFAEEDLNKDEEIGTESFARSLFDEKINTNFVLGRMKHPEKCVVKKGFFPSTAAGVDAEFAFVSLDVDLYQPTVQGGEFFIPRLSKNGLIFVHDYFSEAFTGVRKAVLELSQQFDLKLFPIGDGCSIGIMK